MAVGIAPTSRDVFADLMFTFSDVMRSCPSQRRIDPLHSLDFQVPRDLLSVPPKGMLIYSAIGLISVSFPFS